MYLVRSLTGIVAGEGFQQGRPAAARVAGRHSGFLLELFLVGEHDGEAVVGAVHGAVASGDRCQG